MNILLVGKAASGKDFMKNYLSKQHKYRVSTSHTTRPARKGEVDGVDYYFISPLKFKIMSFFRLFFEEKTFNGWGYGTSKKEMKNSKVFIFTPGGIAKLPKSFLDNSIIIYFNISSRDRLDRLMKRSDSDSMVRRMRADCEDFKDFHTWDIMVTEAEFKPFVLWLDCVNLEYRKLKRKQR